MAVTAASAREAEPRHSYRWAMLALVWASYVSFGVVNNSTAPLVSAVMRDLDLSFTQMGTILGAWPVVYIGVAYLAGAFIDRVGLRVSVGIGVLLVALSGILRGLATGFETMLACVAVFGLGGPLISIGAPKAISVWFAGRERGTAVGFYSTAPTVGAITALATANSLVLPLVGSWRGVFVFYGVATVAVAAVWWLAARDAPPGAQGPPADPHGRARNDGAPLSMMALVRMRTVWTILIIVFGGFLVGHAINAWLPRVLQSYGMTAVDAGLWAAVTTALGLPGVLLVPRWSPPGRRRYVVALILAMAGAGTLAMSTGAGPLLVAGLALYGLLRASLLPVLILTLMDSPAVGARNMGAVAGLAFTTGEVGGFLGPFLMGSLLDLTGAFLSGLVVLSIISFVMVPVTLLVAEPRRSRDEAAEH